MAISITPDAIEVSLWVGTEAWSSHTGKGRDTSLDLTYNAAHLTDGVPDGIPVLSVTMSGSWLNILIQPDAIEISLSQSGSGFEGTLIDSSPIEITFSVPTDETSILIEAVKKNWIAWSKIGKADFTKGRDNVAGTGPMDWKGFVWAIKKHGGRVVVYGENGISIMTPAGNIWGETKIYGIGLKSRQAVAGSDSIHYFIDSKDQLFEFGEGLKKLNFSEFLSVLTNPVLSLDEETGFLYICDGTTGFIYSPGMASLGQGPPNVTGLGYQDGTQLVVSPSTISIPTAEICTDIYDFGTRQWKNIYSLEIGTDMTGTLSAAIDYRDDMTSDFSTTDWETVDERGLVFIPCSGKEFRFRLKMGSYEYTTIDYIRVDGEVNYN